MTPSIVSAAAAEGLVGGARDVEGARARWFRTLNSPWGPWVGRGRFHTARGGFSPILAPSGLPRPTSPTPTDDRGFEATLPESRWTTHCLLVA
jgi:hypothetical protein